MHDAGADADTSSTKDSASDSSSNGSFDRFPTWAMWVVGLAALTVILVAIDVVATSLEPSNWGYKAGVEVDQAIDRMENNLGFMPDFPPDIGRKTGVNVDPAIDWMWAKLVFVRNFPFNYGREIGLKIDQAIDWMKANLGFIFRAVRWAVVSSLSPLEDAIKWLPWPVTVIGLGALVWHVVGYRMAIFTVVALLVLATFGLWDATMETAALMVVTVTLCVLIAIPLGIWASQSDLLDALLRPLLDGMQTMPSFVYLVPAIAFFSLGDVPAVIATLIYAVPPAVRLTNLGIRQVPEDTIEAVESFGATSRQTMLKVKIPLAMPTIMAGVNQTILMALAMVVIASLVGAGGLGEHVLRGLGRLEPGNALLAGLGIVFLAIIIDRLTQAYARRKQSALGVDDSDE